MISLTKEFGAAMMNGRRSADEINRIKDILERAANELRGVGKAG